MLDQSPTCTKAPTRPCHCHHHPTPCTCHSCTPPPRSLLPPQAPADAEGPLLRTALELCQDTEYPVRIAMCQQLPAVSKAISRELVGAGLLDETLELLRDEEAQVGGGGWGAAGVQLSCMPVCLHGVWLMFRAPGCVLGSLPAGAATSLQYSAVRR